MLEVSDTVSGTFQTIQKGRGAHVKRQREQTEEAICVTSSKMKQVASTTAFSCSSQNQLPTCICKHVDTELKM